MSWISDDITFCNALIRIDLKGWIDEPITHTVECPQKSKCHRFINQPKEHPWMSVFVEAPYDYSKEVCEFYWEITRKEKKESIKKTYSKKHREVKND